MRQHLDQIQLLEMQLYLYLKHFPPYGNDLHEGTRKAVDGLATGLVQCGANVTILCESIRDSEYQSEAGYTIRCFANPKSKETDTIDKTASFTLAPGLEPFLRQHRDGLFVLNGIFHRSLASLSRLLRKYSIPYVVSPFDPYHPAIFKKNAYLKWPYWYLLEKSMLQHAEAIQLLDARHSEWLRRLQIKTPAFEVPGGFTSNALLPETQLNWRADNPVRLYFLGRLDIYNKGIDLLLKAFAEVAQQVDARLTIQGPDWANERLQLEAQAAQLGIQEILEFLPPDYGKTPPEMIAAHDVLCVPSRFEGFSLSALEAMLAGRPVLVTEIAGIAPHVQASQCGVVAQPTVESIKAGLLDLIQARSEWKAMGLRGRDYALSDLNWKSIAANALEQYHRLAASSKSS